MEYGSPHPELDARYGVAESRHSRLLLVAIAFAVLMVSYSDAASAATPRLSWGAARTVEHLSGTDVATGLSCASASFCVLINERGIGIGSNISRSAGDVVVKHGAKWSKPLDADPGHGGLSSISCPRTNFCLAVDPAGYYVSYNGKAWTEPAFIGRGLNPTSVSCSSFAFCVVLDGNSRAIIRRNGKWEAPQKVPGNVTDHVSCASSRLCAAIAENDHAAVFNGNSWKVKTLAKSSKDELGSVSCSSNRLCMAVSTSGNAYQFNGNKWLSKKHLAHTTGPTGGGLGGISCVGRSCVTVGLGLQDYPSISDLFANGRWRPATALHLRSAEYVSCVPGGFCLAAGVYGRVASGSTGVK